MTEYEEFTEKFKIKKTTDDCETPEAVYEAVANYVANHYGIERDRFVRPFWPGADYTKHEYKPGQVVVDNPPFSKLSEICMYYSEHNVKCFIFAPTLTILTSIRRAPGMSAVICGYTVTYDNGARIETSFVTNLEPDTLIRTAPDLYEKVKAADEQNRQHDAKQKIRYSYPPEVLTATMVRDFARYGIEYKLSTEDARPVLDLDEQRRQGKGIYGTGLLISETAAREKERAEEQLTAEKIRRKKESMTEWQLSNRERAIIRELSRDKDE